MSSSWLQLSHKTAIITGAGSGIGSAIARAFAGQGCNVLLVDIHGENVKHMSNECQKMFVHHEEGKEKQQQWTKYVIADMTNKKQVCDMMQYADSLAKESYEINYKPVSNGDGGDDETIIPPNHRFASILVNAAGITKDGLIHDISEVDYDKVMDTNLKGTFLACQAFCNPERLDYILGLETKSISKQKQTVGNSASIINIGSIISELGNIGQTNYAASKGGVVGLTRALAKEMAFYSTRQNIKNSEDEKNMKKEIMERRSNIRVNAILPGFIHTPMSEAVPDNVKERIKNQIPLKEFGTVDDIANMALFLASSRSSYVTGTTLECSGMISI